MGLVLVVASVALMTWLVTQCRKPNGPLGKAILTAMNVGHSGLTDWGLGQVPIHGGDTVLDVGCGGGRTLQKLAAMTPNGKVCGVDYSKASVAASRHANAADIQRGHVRIEEASVAALPFPDRTFDVVTAVETHYYWPDLVSSFAEVLRVLKPGGTILIIAETFREGRSAGATGAVMRMLRGKLLTLDEHRDLLERAGFVDATTSRMPGKPWMCAVGRRPS